YFFFGSGALLVWLVTNVFSRLNSFLNPGTKSLVPYSKRTTKLKVKNTNKATQKSVRIRAMAVTVTYSSSAVNVADGNVKFAFEPGPETAMLSSYMRVPLLDLSQQYHALAEPIRAEIDQVLSSQRFILGPKVQEF